MIAATGSGPTAVTSPGPTAGPGLVTGSQADLQSTASTPPGWCVQTPLLRWGQSTFLQTLRTRAGQTSPSGRRAIPPARRDAGTLAVPAGPLPRALRPGPRSTSPRPAALALEDDTDTNASRRQRKDHAMSTVDTTGMGENAYPGDAATATGPAGRSEEEYPTTVVTRCPPKTSTASTAARYTTWPPTRRWSAASPSRSGSTPTRGAGLDSTTSCGGWTWSPTTGTPALTRTRSGPRRSSPAPMPRQPWLGPGARSLPPNGWLASVGSALARLLVRTLRVRQAPLRASHRHP